MCIRDSSHRGVDDAAAVAPVREVGICLDISKKDAVVADYQRKEATQTCLVGCASGLGLSLDTNLRFDDVLELNTHHTEVTGAAMPISLCRESGDC